MSAHLKSTRLSPDPVMRFLSPVFLLTSLLVKSLARARARTDLETLKIVRRLAAGGREEFLTVNPPSFRDDRARTRLNPSPISDGGGGKREPPRSPLSRLMALPRGYISPARFSRARARVAPRVARTRRCAPTSERQFSLIARADRDKDAAAHVRIAIKPNRRAARLGSFIFFLCDSPCALPGIIGNPSSLRRTTDIGTGSRWPYPIHNPVPPASEFSQDEICMYALSPRPAAPLSRKPPPIIPFVVLRFAHRARTRPPPQPLRSLPPPPLCLFSPTPLFSTPLVTSLRTIFRQLDTSYYAKQRDRRDIIIIVNAYRDAAS